MKNTIKDWGKVLILLLDDAVVIALVLIVLWVLKVRIPVPIAIIAALLLGTVLFFLHKAIIPTFHKKQITGAEGLIGMEGEVIEPLTPKGVIKVGGENLKAKSAGEDIIAGDYVEILELNGLTLKVRRKGQ
ncbi:NfeD family protein [Candidatus Omnitrophota bacterium]